MGIPIYSTSTDWEEKNICKLVQLLVEAYSGFQEIPYWVWLFLLFPIRVIEYYMFQVGHTKWNLTQSLWYNTFQIQSIYLRFKVYPFLAPILCNLNYQFQLVMWIWKNLSHWTFTRNFGYMHPIINPRK